MRLEACDRCGTLLTRQQKYQRQRFCGRRCFGGWLSEHQRGRDLSAMQQRRTAILLAQSRQRIEAEFGALSERELALVRLALKRGYLKGYKTAIWDGERREAA